MTMQCEEQDKVIQELDVYSSMELSSLLYYLQFPTRYEPFPTSVPMDVKFKPKCQVLELGIPIPTTQNANYCRDKGRAFAASTIAKDEHESLLDKQLWAAHVMPNAAHYMMGTIHDGEYPLLHMHFFLSFLSLFSLCMCVCMYVYMYRDSIFSDAWLHEH